MQSRKIPILVLLSCLAFFSPHTAAYALNLVIINNNNNPDSGTLRLVSSSPYDRQTLDTAPTSVTFTFSQPVKPDKSFIRVYNLTGSEIEVGELEAQGKSMSVTLPELTQDKYTIKWKAHCQCNDDNEISNSFHFTVR